MPVQVIFRHTLAMIDSKEVYYCFSKLQGVFMRGRLKPAKLPKLKANYSDRDSLR